MIELTAKILELAEKLRSSAKGLRERITKQKPPIERLKELSDALGNEAMAAKLEKIVKSCNDNEAKGNRK